MPAIFGLDESVAVEASYNIAPTDNAAVIRLDEDGRQFASMLRWGLIPFWAKDRAIGNRLINARSETAREKPAFRAAYRKRRCVIPVDGFYEWRAERSGKQPVYISARDGNPFRFAGLWESWSGPDEAGSVDTFTILTRSPNTYLERVHKRMPVIVDADSSAAWLSGSLDLGPGGDQFPITPDDFLSAWPVAKTVNNPRNDGTELIVATGPAF